MKEYETLSIGSEAGFKALFEYATIGILVIGRSGNIELANPSIQKLFGYQNAELIGQPIEILIPEAFRKRHVDHREGYFEKPKARPMGLGMELFALKKDQTVFPVEISLGYYELEGEMVAVAFVTDITERKKNEDDLRKLNEELENRVMERTLELTEALEREKGLSEMKSRFVSMASHEFRTPLSAILSSAALVDRYTERADDEKRKKHVDRIKSSVQDLTDILNDFLSLDKLEQGKVEIEKAVFNLQEFSKEIIEQVNNMLKEGQHIQYVHEGESELFEDKKILKNVALNLLSNAIKYSDRGAEIILMTEIKNHVVRIVVKDKGIGIPPEEQAQLFNKFFRAKNAVNIQGTGLGLTIVKRYVELLDGNIYFSSTSDKGTTFTVEFSKEDHE